jgi:hypothetical protein
MLRRMSPVTLLRRILGTAAIALLAAVALAGVYAEVHRAPDQP